MVRNVIRSRCCKIVLMCWLGWCLAPAVPCFSQIPQGGQAQGGRPQTKEDEQTYRDAEGHFNNKRLDQALKAYESIRDVQGPVGENARKKITLIGIINGNNPKWRIVRRQIATREYIAACPALREIQATIQANPELAGWYPEINDYLIRAGGCPAPEPAKPDPIKLDYDRAENLKAQGRLQEARVYYNRVLKADPEYPGVSELIQELDKEIRALNEKSKQRQDEQFAEFLAQARQYRSSGDPRAARVPLEAAENIRSNDSELKQLRQDVESDIKREGDELQSALTEYYGGEYERTQQALESFLQRPHAASITAMARFFTGASLGSRFFLSGGQDESLKNAALQAFRQVRKDDPEFSPPLDAVSPRIKTLYTEAAGK